MKTDTSQKILDYIEQAGETGVQDLIRYLGFSAQAIHRQLKKLLDNNKLEKIGFPPRVFYKLKKEQIIKISALQNTLIESNFVQILPNGKEIFGMVAFENWCKQRNFDPEKYSQKYTEIYQKYKNFFNSQNLIDATDKLQKTYKNQAFLDKLYYLDFSAWEIFGRTKVYTHLLYAKLNENRSFMHSLFEELELKSKIVKFLLQNKIQAVGFVPATVPRKIQFQKELEKYLNLGLPKIAIEKLKTPILVPQKTLATTNERVINSQTTFSISGSFEYQKILLLDDFAGSGATMNFISQKIRQKNQTKNCQIYGLALCGTPNGVVDNSTKLEVVKEI